MASTSHTPKCPCCSNPWAAATGDFFAKLCQECETTDVDGNKSLSRDNMDFAVHPRDNFYQYTNGNWLKNNPIPSGYPNWNSFLTLHVQSQENLKDILMELAAKEDVSEDERKVAAFYQAAMNEEAIEKAGISPMKPLLDLCSEAVEKKNDKAAFATCLGRLAYKYQISPFFSIGASPDKKNSDHSIAEVAQGGIGLPDRDYYYDETKDTERTAYKLCVAKMLTLVVDATAKENSDEAVAKAEKVYELEMSLAEAHMTKTESRDPHDTYNKMSIAQLTENCKGAFDFASYFLAATGKNVDQLGDINVRNTKALERMAEVASTADAETLTAYLQWMSVKSFASYLSQPFVDAQFDFYEKALMGTQEIKPRWKRAMAFTESALGEALGKLYCAKYFDESSKEQALTIVEQVRQALEERLKEVDWMKADSTRENALKKMGRFNVKIG
jgi:putative endopeptidase